MSRNLKRQERVGFTLVELLVVITIIAILASLIVVGASAARSAARRGTILLEMDNLSGSLQDYKSKYGAYPPNTIVHTAVDGNTKVLPDLKRHFKQAFPKHQEPDSLLLALAGVPAPGANPAYRGMNASEALVFWLGGFSSDARYPVSGKGGPSYRAADHVEDLAARNWLYTFDQARLGPRDAEGNFSGRVVTYTDAVGQKRYINLWTYTPSVSSQPYAYFDTSRYKPAQYDPISNGICALKMPSAGGGTQVQFVNSQSFQILHSGLDNMWGDFAPLTFRAIAGGSGNRILYPVGPFTEELADNLVSFSRNTLEDSEP